MTIRPDLQRPRVPARARPRSGGERPWWADLLLGMAAVIVLLGVGGVWLAILQAR